MQNIFYIYSVYELNSIKAEKNYFYSIKSAYIHTMCGRSDKHITFAMSRLLVGYMEAKGTTKNLEFLYGMCRGCSPTCVWLQDKGVQCPVIIVLTVMITRKT